jgi:hypothetical protein
LSAALENALQDQPLYTVPTWHPLHADDPYQLNKLEPKLERLSSISSIVSSGEFSPRLHLSQGPNIADLLAAAEASGPAGEIMVPPPFLSKLSK